MTVFVADAHSHVQRLVSVVKMMTVFEVCTTEKQRSVVRFLWAKGLSVKNIHKEMIPVYGVECSWRKAVQNRVEKLSQGRSKVADDAQQVRK
jgi:steroid 5-alpha reductase family enzyme